MKMREEEEHEKESGERWVLTYADLITLLMVFFVVMYSMSSIDKNKYAAMAEQLSVTLGGASKSVISPGTGADTTKLESKSGTSIIPTTSKEDNPASMEQKTENSNLGSGRFLSKSEEKLLDDVESKIKEYIKQQNLSAQVSVSKDSRGTVISFTEALLFEKGSAEIQQYRVGVINKIADIILSTANFIRVEGFTDDLSIHTSKFDSNWELAAQRAVNVGKALINEGIDPNRISCLSYGQYRPIVENDCEENRAKNRRVDIILIYKTLDNLEPGMNN